MIRDIKYEEDAQKSILNGIKKTVDAVKVTLGPKGNYVIIKDLSGEPKVTKDGVTVVKSIELSDPYENVGASLIRQAANQTLSVVGDATTTSSILTYAIISRGLEYISKGANRVKLIKGIQEASKEVEDYINSLVEDIKDDDISAIATISANNDAEIGNLIGEAFKKIGREGVITIEDSQNLETSVKVVNGLHFDRGYVSPHFVTDEVKGLCVLENPYILITEHKLLRLRDLKQILEYIVSENKPLLIIAEDFDEEVIETLKYNKLNGALKVCAIKAPSFGKYRKEILEDIAICTEGVNISYESGLELSGVSIADLGTCGKVVISKDHTTIINSKGDITNRVKQIQNQLQDIINSPELDGSFLIDFYKNRIAMLTGGIATIYVGGKTEIEQQERKDRIDDAICATKAAISGGILPGGGIIYYTSRDIISQDSDESINMGRLTLKEALISPIEILLSNAGVNPADILSKITTTIGYDANQEIITDMKEAGIIDPANAIKLALVNAVSVATLFLGTRCIIVPKMSNEIIM